MNPILKQKKGLRWSERPRSFDKHVENLEQRAVDVENVTKRRCSRTQVRGREMDQKGKMLDDKTDNLSLIPGTRMV